jgi:hypothetical protein
MVVSQLHTYQIILTFNFLKNNVAKSLFDSCLFEVEQNVMSVTSAIMINYCKYKGQV